MKKVLTIILLLSAVLGRGQIITETYLGTINNMTYVRYAFKVDSILEIPKDTARYAKTNAIAYKNGLWIKTPTRWVRILTDSSSSGGTGVWGGITGTLTNQTDLNSALAGKVPSTRTITINGVGFDLSANRSWNLATGGDVSSNTSTSVESELALFTGTTGKLIKRATGTGFVKVVSGVASIASLINAGTELTGTMPDGVLGPNVPLKNTTNVFTGASNLFMGPYAIDSARLRVLSYSVQPVSLNRVLTSVNLYWDGTQFRYRETGYGTAIEHLNGGILVRGSVSGSGGTVATTVPLMEVPFTGGPRFENISGAGTVGLTASPTGVIARGTALLTTADVAAQIKDSLDRNATYLRNPVLPTFDTLVQKESDSVFIIKGMRFVAGTGISIGKVSTDSGYQYTITNTSGGTYTPGNAKQIPDANYTIDLAADDFIRLPNPTVARTLTLPAASTAHGKIVRIYNRSDLISDWILSGSYIQDGSQLDTEDFINSGLKLGTTTVQSFEVSTGVWKWQEIK